MHSRAPRFSIKSFDRILLQRYFTMPQQNKLASTDISAPSTTIPEQNPLPQTFQDGLPLPKLIVFDLDYTLWPFWSDTHLSPPLKPTPSALKVKDRHGEAFGFFPEVGGVLDAIKSKGILIGVASRTDRGDLAREMLRLLRIPGPGDAEGQGKKAREFFDQLEIYPGSKVTHFKKLHAATGLPYSEMLFFDDESRNRDTEKLGVTMKLVRDGVTRNEVDLGIQRWREQNMRFK